MHPEDLVEVRTKLIQSGVGEQWIWPKCDNGAWDGPLINWENAHRHDYFAKIRKYDTVVTAGANCGLHTRVYSTLFKQVYAFEPHWLNFYCLARNCPEKHVFKFNCALGSRSGIAYLSDGSDDNMGCYAIHPQSDNIITMLTIDNLNLEACDFIQLDVEGFEGEVLEGAEQTIAKFRPTIALETINTKVMDILTKYEYIRLNPHNGGDAVFYYEGDLNASSS